LFIDIFLDAIRDGKTEDIPLDATDNLLLYLQKMIRDAGTNIDRFLPSLEYAFGRIAALPRPDFFRFVISFYPLKKIAQEYLAAVKSEGVSFGAVNQLMIRYFEETYAEWLSIEDPEAWFVGEAEISTSPVLDALFEPISHGFLREQRQNLKRLQESFPTDSRDLLRNLLDLAGHNQIAERYRQTPMALWKSGANITQSNQWKVIFLFHIMHIDGLLLIHEETLREINRTLTWLIGNESHRNIMRLIQKTFSILSERTQIQPQTALNCILNMGKGVYKTDQSDLVNFFIESVIELGFQLPMVGEVDNNWQIHVNPSHIQNIRTWLELIELNPKWSTRLLSSLIIYLALGGVFIKDTDLFPRDITQFLNSDIRGVYNLAKQLMRMFPAFFNEIGAEGHLRDISTQLDEMTRRKDELIHFLRKQSHVESSNRIIDLIEAVIDFWYSREPSKLKDLVPPSIYEHIETTGPYIDGVHRIMQHLARHGIPGPEALRQTDEVTLDHLIGADSGFDHTDVLRVRYLAEFYRLLRNKYYPDMVAIQQYIESLAGIGFPNVLRLKDILAEPDTCRKAEKLLTFVSDLKAIILSKQKFEVREDIYKKRHVTVDIPSMYGRYNEMKFDALGLTFRVESFVNVLLEDLVERFDLSLITKATVQQLHDLLKLFEKALDLDGIHSVELERQLDFLYESLQMRGFTFTQYIDVFKGFAQAVKNIIADYFHNVHEENLGRILSTFPLEQLQPRFRSADEPEDREKLQHRVSEIFFRDRIAFSPGLQQLDRFLTRILGVLFHQSEKLHTEQLRMLLLYDPYKAMASIDSESRSIPGIIHIGNKGTNLVRLKRYGLPIPPGFIITTEVFRCQDIIESYEPARRNFHCQLRRHIQQIEKITGKTFGNPENPLLFSVRSGSAISQPGMMDTLLNVGMNEAIAEGLARKTGNPWFAWDNYRRFLQCYGMALGFSRDHFDAIISDFKQRFDKKLKRFFTGDQMHEVALAYKQSILDAGQKICDDPFEQLNITIRSVLKSWESDKARTYREIMGISDDWGTAVAVQSMVFGNLSRESGTGVIFTHNPRWSGERIRLWGDFTVGNQGEDVVSGLVTTLPISIFQQEIESRETDITLETHFPEIFMALEDLATLLIEKKGWTPQEIEFTFESPTVQGLYILQTRDMAMRERKKVTSFQKEFLKNENFLGHGIGVSGGAMSGRIVFSLDEIDRLRLSNPNDMLILARADTVPDDIREIYATDGLLTARGGLTSHAAVVAHRLGKTCVVGFANMTCVERDKQCKFNELILTTGDWISIDGQEGSVYRGQVPIKVS
jgi:pyruvate,orthophosphate dikinase